MLNLLQQDDAKTKMLFRFTQKHKLKLIKVIGFINIKSWFDIINIVNIN